MKHLFTILSLVLYCTNMLYVSAQTANMPISLANDGQKYMEGQLFVKFSNACDFTWQPDNVAQNTLLQNNFPDLQQLLQQYGVQKINKAFRLKSPRLNDIYLLETANHNTILALMRQLSALNYVVYAEQVPLYRTSACPPNDALFAEQWSLQNTHALAALSALTNGTCDVANATCAEETVIAIVDDAVLYTHEDLSPKMWSNPNEIANNGIDDDANGYIDDIMGWDAASNDNDPAPEGATNSSFTHGTHCAGIAAAATNNEIGVASPGFNARIMAVKCANVGNGILSHGYLGVEYAIAAQADIISMSWGSWVYSATYQALFDEAYAAGIVCVAAAGNDATSMPLYPAAYNHVISVAASNINNQRAAFSNYGSTIDITAPGQAIRSTLAGSNNAYGNLSGTSMACPFISGVCGMMLCFNPNLDPDAVLSCLQTTATNIDATNPAYIGQLGAGLVNIEGVLQCLQVPPMAAMSFNDVDYCPTQAIQFNDNSVGYNITSRLWTFEGGTPATATDANPIVSFATAGTHLVTLAVSNAYGTDSTTQTVNVGTPTATLNGSTTIVAGTYTSLSVAYSGLLPYNLTYSDGSNSYSIDDIDQNPFYFNVSPTAPTTYTLLNATGGNACAASVGTEQAAVNVLTISSDSICNYTKIYGTSAGNSSGGFYEPTNETFYWLGHYPNCGAIDTRNGNVLWAKNYPGIIAANFTIIGSGAKAPNGDIVMLGSNVWAASGTSSSERNWGIYRSDSLGNLLWAKNLNHVGRQQGENLVATAGDTYVIGGWFNTTGGTSDDYGFVKVDANGNQVAAKSVTVGGDDQMGQMRSDGNGGFYMLGEVEGSEYLVLLHYDANLTLLQSKRINYAGTGGYMLGASSIDRMSDGTLMVTTIGYNGTGIALMNIRADLSTIIWAKRINVPGHSGIIIGSKCVAGASNRFYLQAATANNSWGNRKDFIAEFNMNGTLIQSKSFNASINYLAFVGYDANMPNHELMLGWTIENSPYFGAQDFSFIRTNKDMDDACLLIDYPINVVSDSWSLQAVTTVETPRTFTPIALGNSTQNYNLFVNTPCISCSTAANCSVSCGINASATELCAKDSINLSALCSGYTDYVWVINDTLVFEHGTSASYVFDHAGTYQIKLYVSNGTCSEAYTHSVTVAGIAGVASDDVVICNGDIAQLSASGGIAYQWLPTSGLSCATCPNPQATPNNNTKYYVTITNANGCSLKDSVSVWLAPPPVILPISADTLVCHTPITIAINPHEAPISDYSYAWSPATGLSCTNCANPIATLSASRVYTVTITNSMGCTATQNFGVNIASDIPPQPTIDMVSLCNTTDNIPLYGNPSGGVFSGDGVILIGSQYFIDPNAIPTGTTSDITYTISNSLGCSKSTTQSITPPTLPDASFTGLESQYCYGAYSEILTPLTLGGTFSGESVVNNPAENNGLFYIRFVTTIGSPIPITYTVTDPITGCTNSSTQYTTVYNSPNSEFGGIKGIYWSTDTLFSPIPEVGGGVFSSTCGISNFEAINPADLVGNGSCCIDYTVSQNGCTSSTQSCFQLYACSPPSNINVSAVSDSSISINWSALLGANTSGYVVEYRIIGTSTWTSLNVLGTNATLNQLNPCAEYQIRVATYCGSSLSAYSNVLVAATPDCSVSLYVKAFLQGCYNATSEQMTSILQNNTLLPNAQPFYGAPWYYAGTETLNVLNTGNINVTDWVLIELRTAPDNAALAIKAALLYKDGTIHNTDGTILSFEGIAPNNYYVLIRSRNHLAVLSASTVALPNNALTMYDFSIAATQAMGNGQQVAISSNKYALFAGDMNANGVIQVADYNIYAAQASSINGYYKSDINLDGNVTTHDFNLLLPNTSRIGIPAVRY